MLLYHPVNILELSLRAVLFAFNFVRTFGHLGLLGGPQVPQGQERVYSSSPASVSKPIAVVFESNNDAYSYSYSSGKLKDSGLILVHTEH